jgi:GxxExxY protein
VTSGESHAGLTRNIIGAAIDVHRAPGPGLLESAYEACLAHELHERRMRFDRQVELPVSYKECRVKCGFRADFIVGERVIVELKAVDRILPIHEAQLLTYLRLTGIRIGLLINFHSLVLKDGIRRRML